jgi:hypothetical protein
MAHGLDLLARAGTDSGARRFRAVRARATAWGGPRYRCQISHASPAAGTRIATRAAYRTTPSTGISRNHSGPSGTRISSCMCPHHSTTLSTS